MTSEAREPIDPYNNPESRSAASDTSVTVSRASDGGAPPRDAPQAGDLPRAEAGGTAEGNPVAGVEISRADADDAVTADEGPDGSASRSNPGHA